MKIPKIVLLLLLSTHLAVMHTQACSCKIDMEELTYPEYFSYDRIALVDVVEDGDAVDTSDGFSITIHWTKVHIIESFKGQDCLDTIWSPRGSCYRDFNVGETYLYYGYSIRNKFAYRIEACDRTKSEGDSTYGSFEHELLFLREMKQAKIDQSKVTYSNGQIAGKGTIKQGQPHGEWVCYFPDGSIMEKGLYRNGVKEGKWYERQFEPSYEEKEYAYEIELKGRYRNGERSGKWTRTLVNFWAPGFDKVDYLNY